MALTTAPIDGATTKVAYTDLVSPAVAGAKNGIVDQMLSGVTARETTAKTLLAMPTGRQR